MRVLLTGGGTGGHLFPLLAVAQAIKKESKEPVEFLYLGPCNKFSKEVFKLQGIKTSHVITGKWRRYFSLLNFVDMVKIPFGIIQALFKVFLFMPDVVFSKGGYGSVPVVAAARIYLIPIVIHESDAIPGKANRFMQHLADVVVTSYNLAAGFSDPTKTIFTGSPVRENILGGEPAKAREAFGITSNKPVLLILGGSQGAKKINEVMIKILPRLLSTYEIIHQCGEKNLEETEELVKDVGVEPNKNGYHLFPFLSDANGEMKNALSAADLVLSRAGATAISEIAAYEKPSILIPIRDSANNHQLHNAFEVAKRDGAIAMEEENLAPELLLRKINTLIDNRSLLKSMGEKVKFFYHPEAAKKIAEIVLKLGNKKAIKPIENKK